MKYLIYGLFFLVSCKQKAKEVSIVGKWEYQKMETYSGQPIDLSNPAINKLHEDQKGWTFFFSKDNVFEVTHVKTDKPEEFVAKQPYELPEDKKHLILKNKGRPDEKFPIIELSDSILKINIFYSDSAYMVFKRKQ
ncbi:MAG: lipocalin family protein [Chitinophagaceae bacterium]|nr:lipocalin family protein [Chitinophagaceae bacterium]